MGLLLLGSSNFAVAAAGCRPLSWLSRSALAFVLGCLVFAFTGIGVHNITSGSESVFARRHAGAAGVRRSSGTNSINNDPPPRRRQDGNMSGATADPGTGSSIVKVEDALNIANAVGLPTLSLLSDGGGATITPPAAANSPRKVVWIMSFGGSGTSYTIMNLEQLTGYTTGTNYAADIHPNVPVVPSFPAGPFLHDPDGSPVPSHVVSKTHCGAYCMDCGPGDYHNMTYETFEAACRTCSVSAAPTANADGSVREALLSSSSSSSSSSPAYSTYDTPIEKAIHLIRSPFDNLVGRMHLASRRRMKRGDSGFDDSPEGYAAWCQYLDAKYQSAEARLTELDHQLPCHAEWYRYVQWHNRAWEVTSRTVDPNDVHYLHYENYSSRYEATVQMLLDFVHMQPAPDREPLPFLSNKTYVEYFSMRDRDRAKQYVQTHAHPHVWELLARYF